MKRNWERDKNKEKDGQRLLCKERLSRPGASSWEKTLLRKQMRELLKIIKGVGTLTRNYVHCLTDTEITKYLISLPGGRLKTMGRGSFTQCIISCGATCSRTLQAVRFFFIAPRKIKPKETFFHGLVNTKALFLAQEVHAGLSSCSPHHHAHECYNYIAMAVPQSCRFQRREEMSEKMTCRAQHLVLHCQPCDR